MLALDVVLLLMIMICIVYCWILNQRIRDLHNSRVEFARMIKEFDAAVIKAETCIEDLSTLSKTTTEQVKKASEDADIVISELKTIYEIGEKTGSKLEAAIKEARKQQEALKSQFAKKGAVENDVAAQNVQDVELADNQEEEFVSEQYIEDADSPEHQNLLEKVLSKITTHRQKGTFDQNTYYDSLRKLSMRK